MKAEGHVRKTIHDGVVQLQASTQPSIQAPALPFIKTAGLGIEQKTVVRRVNLNVRGAQANQLFDLVTQDLNYVGEEAIERRISSLRVSSGPKVGPQPRARKRYFGNSVRFVLQIGKFVRRQITKTLQFCDGAEPSWPPFSLHALLVVPLAPKKSVEIKFTEAANGSRHLALKRLPAHLAVGHDFQADALLQSDSVIDGPVFDQFEFSSSDGSSDEFLLSRKQLRWAEKAADDISVNGDHS